MRAYQLPKGGAGIDALTHVERPAPKPLYRQVLVKVMACSLNYRDLGIVRGTYRMPVRDNLVPLSDGAGEVVEAGPGVTRVKAGDKVAGCFFQRWPGGEPGPHVHASALGGSIDGMLAEYVVLEEEGVVKIPAHLSIEEGATLPCAAVTAWKAMFASRQADRRTNRAAARHRRRLDLRPAIRARDGHRSRSSPHRATRSSSAPRRSAPPAASTTRPRRNGTRRRSHSTGGSGVDQVRRGRRRRIR